MTVTEAIQRINQLLRDDAEKNNTRENILTRKEREALAKLIGMAAELTFGRRVMR